MNIIIGCIILKWKETGDSMKKDQENFAVPCGNVEGL